MVLKELLKNIDVINIVGSTEKNVSALEFDSRKVTADSVFVAQKGATVDGHGFIGKATENGASVIVCEELPDVISDAFIAKTMIFRRKIWAVK